MLQFCANNCRKFCIPHWRRSGKPSAHAHKQKKQLDQHSAYALFPVIKSQKPQSPHGPKTALFHQNRSKKSRSTRMASTSLVSASTLRSVAKQIKHTDMTNLEWFRYRHFVLKKIRRATPYWCWIWWVYSMMAIPHSYTVARDHLFKQDKGTEMAALFGCNCLILNINLVPMCNCIYHYYQCRCQKVQQLFMSDVNQINPRQVNYLDAVHCSSNNRSNNWCVHLFSTFLNMTMSVIHVLTRDRYELKSLKKDHL